MARSVVTVYDTRIDGLFTPGTGTAARSTAIALRMIKVLAQRGAPSRTSTLRAAHGNSGVLKRGKYQCEGRIWNNAPHAFWVHEGTRARITSTSGDGMRVPRVKGPLRGADLPDDMTMGRISVRGQHRQPWLDDAGHQVRLT